MSKLMAGIKTRYSNENTSIQVQIALIFHSYLSVFCVPCYVVFINREVLIKVSKYVEAHSGVIKVPLHNIVAKAWITLFIKLKIDPLKI